MSDRIEIEFTAAIADLAHLFAMASAPCGVARLDASVRDSLPVLQHLDRALSLGDSNTSPFCAQLHRLRDVLPWRQNANYAGAEFLAGYGYCELVGPAGLQ